MQVGERVGALLEARDGVVHLVGYGVYAGKGTPTGAVGWLADYARTLGQDNPRLDLDDGKHIWGCECWWGPEAEIRELVQSAREVIAVDIDALRQGWANDHDRPE